MGALVTKALRPIRNFNIENRALKVISKEKPVPAPKYRSNDEDLKRAYEADPHLDEKLNKKDEALDIRLKDVYVTSFGRPEDDITREKKQSNSNKLLPQDRKTVQDYEFGFKEPETLPFGRTTLRHAINFISAHQADPKEITATKIASEYKLRVNDVENILKYFKTYDIYIPETKTRKAIFAGPSTLRNKLKKLNFTELDDKKDSASNDQVVNSKDIKSDSKDIADDKLKMSKN